MARCNQQNLASVYLRSEAAGLGPDLAANRRRIFSCVGGEISKEILWASWKAFRLGVVKPGC
jgi:hypothetical protein